MIMKRIIILCLVGSFLWGCALQKMRFTYEIPQTELAQMDGGELKPLPIESANDHYHVWFYKDKFYVIGTPEANSDFAKNHTLAASKVVAGAGPFGETVVFEANKETPEYADKLIEKFNSTPKLLKSWGNEYFVWKHNDKIYIIGNPITNQLFKQLNSIPRSKTLIQAGPHGETLVAEMKNNDPDFADLLMERYNESPELAEHRDGFFLWNYLGRLYVLGSEKTSKWFETHLYLRHSKAYLGAGPNGETVIIEDGLFDHETHERLVKQYFGRTDMM